MAQPTQISKPASGAEGFSPASTATGPGHLDTHERESDYDPDDHDHGHGGHHHHESGWAEYLRLGLMAVVIVASLTGWWRPWMARDWLALAATLIGGLPIYQEACENLRRRRMTMELSMSLALLAAVCIGQFLTALVIAFFVLFAERLEGHTIGGGRRAIQTLLDALPRRVTVRRGGQDQETDAQEVAPGETILVRPGERIAADGLVVKGHGHVDQASLTGEPLPLEKVVGSKVFAGTLNQAGVLEVRVQRLGRDTTFGKIIEAVERAEGSRAPVQRLADRLAAGLVYFAFGMAVLTFLVTRNLTSTIAVIIVAGACGVAAGTPLAILAGIGRAAHRGIIIKGGVHLEQLSAVDTVVLDKTGTLTLGVPQVVAVRAWNGATQDQVLQAAATAEQHSEHPLGQAIVRRARERHLAVQGYSDLRYFPGKGLVCRTAEGEILVGTRALFEGQGLRAFEAGGLEVGERPDGGETTVLVAQAGVSLGAITLADQLRAEARQAVAALNARGYRTLLLTGDRFETARAIGEALGVHEFVGELLPEQKLAKVRDLLNAGHKVAMVGDGINDAPALAEATLGIAMGQGTDVALETADVTLMTSDLSRLVEVLALSKRCRRVILFNFWGTVLVDTLGMGLAFFGLLAPIAAALIHVGSELAFILNSARLFGSRPPLGNPK